MNRFIRADAHNCPEKKNEIFDLVCCSFMQFFSHVGTEPLLPG